MTVKRMETRDVDAVVTALSRILAPHEMELGGGRAIHAEIRHARFAQCGIADLTYGAPVRIRSRVPHGRVLIHAVAEGRSRITHSGGRTIELGAGEWHVSAPGAPLDIAFGSTSRHFTANLPAEMWPDEGALAGGAAVWIDLMRFALGWAERRPGGTEAAACPVVALMREMLVEGSRRAAVPGAMPWFVRQAHDLVTRRVGAGEEAILLVEVAGRIGVSVRTLQNGLRRFAGKTFGQLVRDARLDALHDRLGTEKGAVDVTTLMHACGIVSTGRYAAYYRERFGIAPSARLRLRGRPS